jgi:hypothetical protein
MLVHSKAINKLAPSDYAMIEKEHQQLEKYLADLRDACACSLLPDSDGPACSKEQQTSCQGRMPSFLFHIIDLAGRHFDHEESIMLSRPNISENNDYFRVHRQAHLDIMKTLQGLADNYFDVTEKSGAAEVYRLFYEKIAGIFDEHDRQFDDPFIESTKQKSVEPNNT